MKRLTAELNMAESAQQAQDMDIQRLANELQVRSTHANYMHPSLTPQFSGDKTKISSSKEA